MLYLEVNGSSAGPAGGSAIRREREITNKRETCKSADRQQSPSFAVCGWCGGEIYLGQLYYEIDTMYLCQECLPTFARSYFLSSLRTAMPPGKKP